MQKAALIGQLLDLGLRRGDSVMVHSSFKSLGVRDPELVITALLETLGEDGILLLPALSYLQEPPDRHDTRTTPSCVGYLAEYFRRRPGTLRSVHPTHSVCGVGRDIHMWLDDHILDETPCGPHSPFRLLPLCRGKILMLGCGLRPNTSMHAVEELARPPYLFGMPLAYTITDAGGRTFIKEYLTHGFQGVGQRYDRVEGLLAGEALSMGRVGYAQSYLIDAAALFEAALARMRQEPEYFVDREPCQE